MKQETKSNKLETKNVEITIVPSTNPDYSDRLSALIESFKRRDQINDFQQTCAVCFETIINGNDRTKSICDTETQEMVRVNLGFEFKLEQIDSYPRAMCGRCCEKIESFVAFKKDSLEKHDAFEVYLKGVKNEHATTFDDDQPENYSDDKPHEEITKEISKKCPKKTRIRRVKIKPLIKQCPICLKKIQSAVSLRHHARIHSGEKRSLCHICGKTFTERHNLLAHIKKHGRQAVCEICNRPFYNRGILKLHMKIHKNEPIHTAYTMRCSGHCDALFRDKSHLRSHIRNIRRSSRKINPKTLASYFDKETQRYTCATCRFSTKMTFYFQSHLHAHENESSDVVYSVQCEHCDRLFKDGAAMLQHMTRVRNTERDLERGLPLSPTPQLTLAHFYDKKTRKYVCNICNYATNSSYIFRHVRQHKSTDKTFQYTCHLCPRRFQTVTELHAHTPICETQIRTQNTRVTQTKPGVECDRCGEIQASTQTLKRHIVRVHGIFAEFYNDQTKMYVCPKCRLATNIKPHFFKHLEFHKKEPAHVTYTLKCPNCARLFKSKNFLARHLTNCGAFTDVQCESCALTFDTPRRLKRHVSLAHSHRLVEFFDKSVRGYVCPTCKYKSSDTVRFRKHLHMHEEETGVVYCRECKACGMLFANDEALICHQRSTHVDVGRFFDEAQRLYKCELCAEGIQNPANFRAHLRSHSRKAARGEKRTSAGDGAVKDC